MAKSRSAEHEHQHLIRIEQHLEDMKHSLNRIERHYQHEGPKIMAAIDDLKTAVDNAVTEMQAAAQFIMNHPGTNNDPALADFATRLQAAADALHGVDQA